MSIYEFTHQSPTRFILNKYNKNLYYISSHRKLKINHLKIIYESVLEWCTDCRLCINEVIYTDKRFCMCTFSRVQFFATPWTLALQTPLSMEFSRQEYWRELPFSIPCLCVHVCLVALSRLILCDPMDCSPPGSSICGIFHLRVLEWVAISSSRGSSQPKDRIRVSCVVFIAERFFICWVTREAILMYAVAAAVK